MITKIINFFSKKKYCWYYFKCKLIADDTNSFLSEYFETEYRYCPKSKILQGKDNISKKFITTNPKAHFYNTYYVDVGESIKRIEKEYNRKVRLNKIIR